MEFLDDNQIKVTEDELAYIFRVLDVDADGTITYEEYDFFLKKIVLKIVYCLSKMIKQEIKR